MLRRGLLGVLLLGIAAVVGGLIGYQVGLTSTAAATGATVVITGGFPGFGFLFFLLFIGFVFFAVAGRRRGPWGRGHGHGPWAGPMGPGGPGGSSDPRRLWVAEMHRSLHAEDAAANRPPDPTPAG
jgi:hypothetical protein